MPKDEIHALSLAPMREARERRVMLCTPDAELARSLRDGLTMRGYRVDCVSSAADAVAAVTSRMPDLLVCDDAPPALDGMALLYRLRAEDRPRLPMPIVVLSSFGGPADMAAGKLAGADDLLVKPVPMELLDATIHAQLRLVERVQAAVASDLPSDAEASIGTRGWRALADRLAFGIITSRHGGQPLFANLAARRLAGDCQAKLRSWSRPQPATSAARTGTLGVVSFRILPPASAPGSPDSPVILAHLDLGRPDSATACFATLLFSPDGPSDGIGLMAAALGLTPAETLVAGHLATGKRREEIARLMSVTMPTVNYHLRNIFQKSGTSRQSDAMRLLRSVPLIQPLPVLPSGRA